MPRNYDLPDGHHTIVPGMIIDGGSKLITFLEKAFGGVVVDRYDLPDGKVAHAEVKIGDSVVQFGDVQPGFDAMPCMLSIYVDDVDATYRKALECGAKSLEEPKNQFYGYRSARVVDPVGNKWNISAIIEQLTKEEIERRMADLPQG